MPVPVLLVDDEALLRDLAAQHLTRAGYEVVTASGGEEALELFARTPDRFGLVMTDLSMPRGNGTDLIAAIRNLRPDQPIIASSGLLDPAVRPDDSHIEQLTKPYTLAELLRAVETAIAQPPHRTQPTS